MFARTRLARCESKDIHPCVLETDSCLSHGPNLLVAGSFRAHPTNLVHSEAWSGTYSAEMEMSHLSAGLGCTAFGIRLLS